MITEQRLIFEAKHKVPDGAIYIPEDNSYVWDGAEKLPRQYRSGPSEYNTLWQGYQSALEDRQGEAVALYMPKELHARTKDLVARFATALAEKLYRAELKYDYSDGWIEDDWLDECVEKLHEHVAKGDPLDVAAYCAFLWHHGESTSPQPAQPDQWNAAIEAAADTAHDAIHEAIYKIDDCAPIKAAVVAAILALRKGA